MPRAGIDLRRLLPAVAMAIMAGGAAAQEPPLADDGAGVRIGTILLKPTVTLSATYDDNIFRENADVTRSAILRAGAGISAETDWRRHSLAVEAAVEQGVFTNSSADDYLDAEGAITGILDVNRAARLRLHAGAVREHERRGADDDAPTNLAEPVESRRIFADLTGQYAAGRIRLQPFVGVEKRDFGDVSLVGGGVSDQDDRDRTIWRAGAKVAYRPPGRLEYFAEGSVARTDFDRALNDGGVDRDNTAYRGKIGVALEKRGPLSGSVAIGVTRRRNEDPALRDFTALSAEAAVSWRPSRLIELDLTARRSVEETTIAAASSVEVTAIGLVGRYEVRRFVDLVGEIGYERRRFRGAGRVDEQITVGAGADWRARRDATIKLRYRHRDESSDAPGESYNVNEVVLTGEYRF